MFSRWPLQGNVHVDHFVPPRAIGIFRFGTALS
jgi:hypothetical protein